jgi:uncharacterized membrane protein
MFPYEFHSTDLPFQKELPMSNQTTETKNTLMCILSYFGIFALIPYFTQKGNAYINWHSRQGLLITAIAIVVSFALGVFSLMPVVGWIAGMASMLFSVGFIGLCVFCMIQACGGKKWAVPGLSGLLR